MTQNVQKFLDAASTEASHDYVPPASKEVLAHTKLLGPGESDTVTFNAPFVPGRVSLSLLVPGSLHSGHEGLHDSEINSDNQNNENPNKYWISGAIALVATRPHRVAGNKASTAKNDRAQNALDTYVAPGEKDEYYLFYSGGHSGQVFVAGIPSMRHITTIPVFAPYPATGYGFDEESKKMMGDYTWGDVHHPGLSQTASKYDGRWLFVNDNANNRIARIDLHDFKTHQILGPIPNSMGNHGSSFITENSEYILCATRFSVPLPKGRVADPKDYEKEFNGMVSGIKVDPKTGEMKVGWQILTPPFDWDLGSTGKGPSSGWAFWTSYNTEMAHDVLESNASQKDRDLCAIVNWRAAEKAVADGQATDDGRRADHRSGESAWRYVFRRDREIAARDGCRSDRQVDRRWRQTPTGNDGLNFEKLQSGDRKDKTSFMAAISAAIPVVKYERRGRRRSAGRTRAAAHPV